jgi:magnesium-transporting ATPase (P-type)
MEQPTASYRRARTARVFLTKIIITGFLVGTLDILGAVIVYQAAPDRLFRAIASGAFGAGAAFSGGTIMIFWGVLFHFIIAFAWTILFFLVYPMFPSLWKNKYITGALYGVFVWIVMNIIVIPLSAIAPRPFEFTSAAIGASILVVAVGMPIAILAHGYYSRKGILRGDP